MSQLKKRVIITSGPLPENDQDLDVQVTSLKSVFDRLEQAQHNPLLTKGGPAGAYAFEPSAGLYSYLLNYLNRTHGVILQVSSVHRTETTETLMISFDDIGQALAEYEVLIQNELEGRQVETEALGSELLLTQRLASSFDPGVMAST